MCQLDRLRSLRGEIYEIARKHKADKVYVFGSCARGEETPDSDIDLLVELPQLSPEELTSAPPGEASSAIRDRVVAARERQYARMMRVCGRQLCNSRLTPRMLHNFCAVTPSQELLLREAIRRFKLSPRAYDRILKVARTIADLAGSGNIRDEHLFEAVNYRNCQALAPVR